MADEPNKMVVTVAEAVAEALTKRGIHLSQHMPGDERIEFYEGIAEEVLHVIDLAVDINYEDDWAGECRNRPGDGNAFVLRAIEMHVPNLPERGYDVKINDIMGGHELWIDADEWLTWEKP